VAATGALFGLVEDELLDVERELARTALPDDRLMGPLLSMVLPGSGKRLRPALALLACRLGETPRPVMVDMAVGVELLHAASLVHDDVVDDSPTRRGEATLYTRVGNALAVLVGDYLFSQSAARCVATGHQRVIGLFAATLGLMVEGQIREASGGSRPHLTLTRDDYVRTIFGKTASLFVLACEGGALLGGASEKRVLALREFGRSIVLAFQMVDDILDYSGDETRMGKPVGSDLRQGIVTLPLLHFRETLPAAEFADLYETASADHLVQRVRDSGAIERAYADAEAEIALARQALTRIPPGPARDTLDEIALLAVRRSA
jgi:geranylgeranyl pyrophosphate synthase